MDANPGKWGVRRLQVYINANLSTYDRRLNHIRNLLLFAEEAVVFTRHQHQVANLIKARAVRSALAQQRKKIK
jgi:hypothetical protein